MNSFDHSSTKASDKMLNYEADIPAAGEPADAAEIIARARELDEKSVFLEGLSERLNALGLN